MTHDDDNDRQRDDNTSNEVLSEEPAAASPEAAVHPVAYFDRLLQEHSSPSLRPHEDAVEKTLL